MEIEIDLSKTIEENATMYYNKSKDARKTIVGLHKALEVAVKKSISKEEKNWLKLSVLKNGLNNSGGFSSDGFLVVGGKDAKSNENVVKKE